MHSSRSEENGGRKVTSKESWNICHMLTWIRKIQHGTIVTWRIHWWFPSCSTRHVTIQLDDFSAEVGMCFLGRLRAAAPGGGQAHRRKTGNSRNWFYLVSLPVCWVTWSMALASPGGTGWQGCFPTPCWMLEALAAQSSLEPRWPAMKHDEFSAVLLEMQ